MRARTWIIALVLAAIIVIFIFVFLNDSANQATLEIGGNQVSTLYSTAGEKTLTGIKRHTGDEEKAEYTYSGVTDEEIGAYVTKLTEEGFTVLSEQAGEYRLEKAGSAEGSSVEVAIRKGSGGETVMTYSVVSK